MADLSQNLIAWTYKDDRGVNWRVAAKKAITDQLNVAAVKVGGQAAAGTLAKLPSWIKPRKRYVSNGTIVRSVVCYDTTCDAWTTPGFQINLSTSGDTAMFTGTQGRYAERSRTGITQAA
jgi:hypothetical protein